MSSSTAYDAFEAKLAAELGGTYSIVSWEDTDLLEKGSDPFLVIEEDITTEDAISIGAPGSNCVREDGTMSVHVFTPSINGLKPTRTIAETVRDAMRYQSLDNGVLTKVASPPYVSRVNKAKWSIMAVDIEYQLDLHR